MKNAVIIVVQLLKWVLPIALGIALLVGIICLMAGWRTIQEYATGLQYGAVVAFIIGGLSFAGDFKRSRLETHRPSDITAQYQYRISLFDNSIYQFLVGVLVAAVLYLISKYLYQVAGLLMKSRTTPLAGDPACSRWVSSAKSQKFV